MRTVNGEECVLDRRRSFIYNFLLVLRLVLIMIYILLYISYNYNYNYIWVVYLVIWGLEEIKEEIKLAKKFKKHDRQLGFLYTRA
jgi:hypothetical protein